MLVVHTSFPTCWKDVAKSRSDFKQEHLKNTYLCQDPTPPILYMTDMIKTICGSIWSSRSPPKSNHTCAIVDITWIFNQNLYTTFWFILQIDKQQTANYITTLLGVIKLCKKYLPIPLLHYLKSILRPWWFKTKGITTTDHVNKWWENWYNMWLVLNEKTAPTWNKDCPYNLLLITCIVLCIVYLYSA